MDSNKEDKGDKRAQHLRHHDVRSPETDAHAGSPAPNMLASLSPDALKAVKECHDAIGRHAYTPPQEQTLSDAVPKAKHPNKFMAKVKQIEDMTQPSLYTQERYDAELMRAKEYTDAFVSQLKLPAEGDEPARQRKALREKFHAIIDGAAGMETGWSPDEVRGFRRPAAQRRLPDPVVLYEGSA